jgi:hypothetical protein
MLTYNFLLVKLLFNELGHIYIAVIMVTFHYAFLDKITVSFMPLFLKVYLITRKILLQQ